MYKKKQKVDKNTINFEKIMFHYNIYNEHLLTSCVAIKFNLYSYQMRSAKKLQSMEWREQVCHLTEHIKHPGSFVEISTYLYYTLLYYTYYVLHSSNAIEI